MDPAANPCLKRKILNIIVNVRRERGVGQGTQNAFCFFCRWSQASEREGREGETHLGYRAGLKSLILSGSSFSQLLNKAPEKTVLSLGGGKGKFIRLNAQDDLKGLSCACPEAFHCGSQSRRRE